MTDVNAWDEDKNNVDREAASAFMNLSRVLLVKVIGSDETLME